MKQVELLQRLAMLNRHFRFSEVIAEVVDDQLADLSIKSGNHVQHMGLLSHKDLDIFLNGMMYGMSLIKVEGGGKP
jgi:hypothetical protein